MKRIAVLALFAVSLAAVAQQPVQPQTTPAQVEIQKEAELLSSQTQLLYEKLHGLQEFQDYLADLQKMQQLQQRYQAAAAKPEVKPKAEPVKPEAPVNPQPKPTTK